MLCRFCQIVNFTKSTFKMSILSNKHVDFVKSTFDKIGITYIYMYTKRTKVFAHTKFIT